MHGTYCKGVLEDVHVCYGCLTLVVDRRRKGRGGKQRDSRTDLGKLHNCVLITENEDMYSANVILGMLARELNWKIYSDWASSAFYCYFPPS